MERAPERKYKILLDLENQPEGGYTVTSPDLPELLTEGDTLEEALKNARDAFAAVLEMYEEAGSRLPEHLLQRTDTATIHTEWLVGAP